MRLPFDDLVLFTGEGLRRLQGFAQRFELEAAFLLKVKPVRHEHVRKNHVRQRGAIAEAQRDRLSRRWQRVDIVSRCHQHVTDWQA